MLKCASSPIMSIYYSWPLTFDIPQGEVSIAGGFWGQGENEAMSRLWLISVHHTNRVNQLRKEEQQRRNENKSKRKQRNRR